MTNEEVEKYVSYTSSDYMKWATVHITNWNPENTCENLYHIHGDRDQIFPSKLVKNVCLIENADDLMVLRKSEEVSWIISDILL